MLFRVEQCFLELTHREEIFSCSYRALFRHHRDDDVHLLTVRTHPEYIKHNATEFRVRWHFIALMHHLQQGSAHNGFRASE